MCSALQTGRPRVQKAPKITSASHAKWAIRIRTATRAITRASSLHPIALMRGSGGRDCQIAGRALSLSHLSNLFLGQSLGCLAHVGRLDCNECTEAARTCAQGVKRGHVDTCFRQFARQPDNCAETVFTFY